MIIETGPKNKLDLITVAVALNTANKYILGNSELKVMLDRLGAEGIDNIALQQVLANWSGMANAGNKAAIDALVVAGAFMYDGWRNRITDRSARVFVAQKATEMILSLDDPKPGAISNYGKETFDTVLLPMMLYGNIFDEEMKCNYVSAISRYSYPSTPHYLLNGSVGWRSRLSGYLENVKWTLTEIAQNIQYGRLRSQIEAVNNNI